jgi:hypothetical protein
MVECILHPDGEQTFTGGARVCSPGVFVRMSYAKGRRVMRSTGEHECSESARVGIVIAVIDILAMLGVIAIICMADFKF